MEQKEGDITGQREGTETMIRRGNRTEAGQTEVSLQCVGETSLLPLVRAH